jgi:hypothetical protein
VTDTLIRTNNHLYNQSPFDPTKQIGLNNSSPKKKNSKYLLKNNLCIKIDSQAYDYIPVGKSTFPPKKNSIDTTSITVLVCGFSIAYHTHYIFLRLQRTLHFFNCKGSNVRQVPIMCRTPNTTPTHIGYIQSLFTSIFSSY